MLRINNDVYFNRPYFIIDGNKGTWLTIPQGTVGRVMNFTDVFGEMTYDLVLKGFKVKYVSGIFREVLSRIVP